MKRGLIRPFELAYRGINRVRRSLYETGVLRRRTLPRPVISIGNISVGGSGKTPTVIALARGLMKRGFRVVVLTRGYGSAVSRRGEVVSTTDAARYGDEPIVIAKALPDVPVIVGRRRFQAASRFLESSDCDVFILDDGFQHLQLSRNVDVVLVRFGSSELLREGPSALKSADMTIARVRDRGEIAFADLRPAESFFGLLEPVDLMLADTILPLEKLSSTRVFAFSGLADNQQFFDMLRSTGANIVGSEKFRDHHRYSFREVQRLKKAAEEAGVDLMVTTEKDAVKIDDTSIASLRVQMKVIPEEAFFKELVKRLESRN